MITIKQHPSAGYPPRTSMNANYADLTIAFAIDFNSPGEKLTRKVAARKYQPVSLDADVTKSAVIVYHAIKNHNARIINIAGHSLPTLQKYGWSQEAVNRHLFLILQSVTKDIPIEKIISGGQTGVDIAGIVAGHALGIESVATLPKGFLQRTMDGNDVFSDPESIHSQIVEWSTLLKTTKRTDSLIEYQ